MSAAKKICLLQPLRRIDSSMLKSSKICMHSCKLWKTKDGFKHKQQAVRFCLVLERWACKYTNWPTFRLMLQLPILWGKQNSLKSVHSASGFRILEWRNDAVCLPSGQTQWQEPPSSFVKRQFTGWRGHRASCSAARRYDLLNTLAFWSFLLNGFARHQRFRWTLQ